MALYTGRRVKALLAQLRADYGELIRREQEARTALEEDNRLLKARVLELEGERKTALDTFAMAAREENRRTEEAQAERENAQKELLLLAEKCRLLSSRLLRKYPDEEDASAFAAFETALRRELGLGEEGELDMEEVLSPKQPLDLGKLCKDLGLMEDDET